MGGDTVHTLRIPHQEFSRLLGALRHTSMTLHSCNCTTEGLGARDVFTDAGLLDPATDGDISSLADRLNAGYYDVPAPGGRADQNGEPGSCIITDANRSTEDDCTTHDHVPTGNLRQEPGWYLATLVNAPTARTPPFDVAIQAKSRKHAEHRIYQLYNFNCTSGVGCSMADALSAEPTCDEDALRNRRKHPL